MSIVFYVYFIGVAIFLRFLVRCRMVPSVGKIFEFPFPLRKIWISVARA